MRTTVRSARSASHSSNGTPSMRPKASCPTIRTPFADLARLACGIGRFDPFVALSPTDYRRKFAVPSAQNAFPSAANEYDFLIAEPFELGACSRELPLLALPSCSRLRSSLGAVVGGPNAIGWQKMGPSGDLTDHNPARRYARIPQGIALARCG